MSVAFWKATLNTAEEVALSPVLGSVTRTGMVNWSVVPGTSVMARVGSMTTDHPVVVVVKIRSLSTSDVGSTFKAVSSASVWPVSAASGMVIWTVTGPTKAPPELVTPGGTGGRGGRGGREEGQTCA